MGATYLVVDGRVVGHVRPEDLPGTCRPALGPVQRAIRRIPRPARLAPLIAWEVTKLAVKVFWELLKFAVSLGFRLAWLAFQLMLLLLRLM